MNLKEKSQELKNKLRSGASKWKDQIIDHFTAQNPRLIPAGTYAKRGFDNMWDQYEDKVDEWMDYMVLFIADKNGNYDMGMVMDDLMTMLKTMEETPFNLGPVRGMMGKGVIKIDLPDNFIVSLFAGETKALKLTESDFKLLKDILLQKAA